MGNVPAKPRRQVSRAPRFRALPGSGRVAGGTGVVAGWNWGFQNGRAVLKNGRRRDAAPRRPLWAADRDLRSGSESNSDNDDSAGDILRHLAWMPPSAEKAARDRAKARRRAVDRVVTRAAAAANSYRRKSAGARRR